MPARPLSAALCATLAFCTIALAQSKPATSPAARPTIRPATSPATKPVVITMSAASRPAFKLAELPPPPDGFSAAATAKSATIKPPTSGSGSALGYLGLSVTADGGKTLVDRVDPQSPAATAGIAVGDEVQRINTTDIRYPSQVAETLLALGAGDPVSVAVVRGGQAKEFTATLAATSRPMKISATRAIMGITLKDNPDADGALLDRVTPDYPAARAGLKAGDLITRIDDVAVGAMANITELLASYSPDDTVKVRYRRGDELNEAQVKLVADPRSSQTTQVYVPSNIYKKDTYRLAIITMEYKDMGRSGKIPLNAWPDALFSVNSYTDKSATGQPVYGSLADYFHEVSCGKLKVEGSAFEPVKLSKNRADYAAGTGDRRMLNEAIDLVLKRNGPDALRGFDGVFFLYTGGRMQTNRGNVFWAHRSTVIHQNRRYSYFLCSESADSEGARMSTISTAVHEFGHLLGLPDLYARPENPGSEGLGQWCLMSNQIGNGRPQHMSAWCKEQLGWVKPTVIDPTVKQKLVLSPIAGTTDQCFKVLLRPDGTEYFLLEVRKKSGFDQDLPGEGLLIWRVVRGRPMLEESHGVEGPLGPRSYLRSVPFPTASNRAFTPYTIPSSKPQLGGGSPVFITDIERLPDGRVTFSVGYETY